jgi:dynein heavy chain
VTPTSYIELIRTFQTLLTEKRKVVKELICKYANGFEKIVTTEQSVGKMQENLIKLQPELKKAAEQTEVKMKEVAEKKAEADVLKEAISGEEQIVTTAANAAHAIKEDCNRELELALPDLRAAE